MSKYNITMKQKNDSDYDELYPESLDTQIKLSKDTTGFTGTNVSEVLMELNSKIPSGMAGSSYKIIGSTLNNKKYGIGFGYDFNNFKINENYAGATFSTLDYMAWGVIEEFYGVDYSPSQVIQIDGLISYYNSSNNILSKEYSCQFSTNATSGYLRTRWMIGNIDNNNITCYFGLQSGSNNNYSLWGLNIVALKRSN